MKKQLIIAITIGAAVLTFFAIRKKYRKLNTQPEPETPVIPKRHHLTPVFSNAKKHAMHTPGTE